jgi:hypothetical protein
MDASRVARVQRRLRIDAPAPTAAPPQKKAMAGSLKREASEGAGVGAGAGAGAVGVGGAGAVVGGESSGVQLPVAMHAQRSSQLP